MRKYSLMLFGILYFIVGFSQTTTEKFLKNMSLYSEVKNPKKAKYKAIIREYPNGDKRTDIIKIATKDTITSVAYNGKEPVGVWKILDGSKIVSLDYDFVLDYDTTSSLQSSCEKWNLNDTTMSLEYIALKQSIMKNIWEDFYINDYMRELNASGIAFFKFQVSEEGKIINVKVGYNENILVAKEGARALKKMVVAHNSAHLNLANCWFSMPIKVQIN